MPTPDQWYQVYRGQQLALEKIAADVARLAAGGGGGAAGGGDGTIPFLRLIADEITALRTSLITELGGTTPSLAAIVQALKEIATDTATTNLLLSTEGADSQLGVIAAALEAGTQATDRVAAALVGDPVAADAALDADRALAQLLAPFLKPGSKTPAEEWAASFKYSTGFWSVIDKILPVGADSNALAAGIEALLKPLITTAAGVAKSAMAPFEAPFRAILQAGIDDLLGEIAKAAAANPNAPVKVALAGILAAHRLGHGAHSLSIVAESHPLFHALGFSQLSAAVVDLSGFAPMSQAALRPYIEAAIARPMRYATNQQFMPYIPNENVLADHVRRRTLTLTDFDAWLSKLGYAEGHRDRMIETVWRDPSLRDLALALDDVDVDERWLAPRVRTIGYDDADADQIFRGLLQRTQRGPRARVVSAAAAAATDGLMPIEDYEALLRGLGLRDAIVELELRAVRIKARADYQRQALATYRRQYVAGVIGRADYELSLHALGLTTDRVDLTLADADAQRAPKLQATEEAAIKEIMSQVRTHLVPRYRALFEDGLLSAEAYREVLERAGVAPGLAEQAVSLARTQRDVELSRTGSKTADRTLAQILSDREDLAIVQYRRDQLDDAGLRVALLAVGLTPERADVVVERERVLRLPVPSRPPPIAAEAVDRLTPEFRRRASIEDYRKFRIDEAALYDELVAAGRTPEQADAEVGYEYARRPTPKP
jgi:hypothetical protein